MMMMLMKMERPSTVLIQHVSVPNNLSYTYMMLVMIRITLVMVIMVFFLSSYDWQLGSLPLLDSILDLRNLATIAAILPGTSFY